MSVFGKTSMAEDLDSLADELRNVLARLEAVQVLPADSPREDLIRHYVMRRRELERKMGETLASAG